MREKRRRFLLESPSLVPFKKIKEHTELCKTLQGLQL